MCVSVGVCSLYGPVEEALGVVVVVGLSSHHVQTFDQC